MNLKIFLSTKSALLALLLLAVVVAVPVSATDTPLFSIPGKMTVVFPNDGISTFSSVDYGPLSIPQGLLVSPSSHETTALSSEVNEPRYTLVAFNDPISTRSDVMTISITLYGIPYNITLEKMNFEFINDGIDFYKGSIPGIDNSVVIITVDDDNTLHGSIQLPDDCIEIYPVQDKLHSLRTSQSLHVIYSQKDIVYNETSEIPFCGVEFANEGAGFDIQNDDAFSLSSSSLGEYDWAYINILVVTDAKFYSMALNWKVSAQQYIAQANYYFQRPDINVVLSVVAYDDSNMSMISNHPDVEVRPWSAVSSIYLGNTLSAKNADICLYLGEYDATTQENYLGYTMTRHCWAQMKGKSPFISFYDGSEPARRCVIIHELGHMLGADHPYACSWKVQDGSMWGHSTRYSVMTDTFKGSNHLCEFSSSNLSYHGDSYHDNAKYIRLTKHSISQYRYWVI